MTAWLLAVLWCIGWLTPVAADSGCELECCSGTVCPMSAAEETNPAECDGHAPAPGGNAAGHRVELPDGQCGMGAPCHQVDPDQPWTFKAKLARVPVPEMLAIRDSTPADAPGRPDRRPAPPQPPPPQVA